METATMIALFVFLWTVMILVAIGFVLYEQVKTGFIEVVFRLGKFHRVLRPGPHFILKPFDRAELYSTATHQDEFPAEPEGVDRENSNAAEGKVLPFRIVHQGMEQAIYYVRRNPSNLDEDVTQPEAWKKVRFAELDQAVRDAMAQDNVNSPLTSEMSAVVEWHLKADDEASIKNFIENVDPKNGRNREQEIRKRMNDVTENALQDLLGSCTFGHSTERIALFGTMFQKRIEALVGENSAPSADERPWGIKIDRAFLKPPSAGKRVNEARANLSVARSDKESMIERAEGKKQETILAAEAKAKGDKLAYEVERDRIKAIAQAMKSKDAKFAANLELAREVLPKTKFMVLPSDWGPFAGLMNLGKEIVQNQDEKSDSKPT